ncbi:hypothetical protein FW774_03080 (plasmid) [Pedobacter sp. BS3]|uniref:lysylphosphatidylglycerol synthase domain-containing protein n=1 Tax=Pedobacter sp. BS3 TaxID=2567937 RepID=UPI0011EBD525|nr:lysylphosphatidylglycerol synthase domain-containing protein [Pedobacter sp. BS3]TZF86060.1 hypothetical protein FW774_03080 [Pedobacter sp. BS3]
MSPKAKKLISIGIKAVILVLAFVFIYRRLTHNQNLSNFNHLLKNLPVINVQLVLISVFALMLLNWFLEALKWKFLVKTIEPISLWKAIESVFCGLTWAIFTPNRIGEFGGRVFFLSPRKRIFGVIAMAVGAWGQMVITNVLGSLAIIWFIYRFVPLDDWLFNIIAFVGIVFCLFFLIFYFNIRWLKSLIGSVGFLKRFDKFLAILSRYRRRDLLKVFSYCVLRFAVFTSQYYLVIHLLVPALPVFEMVMMILILFFIQSALPSLDLLDVGVRSMTATYFFSYITNQDIAIMAAAACIWLVNLIIPAILGSVFVLKLNFFGTNRN